MSELWAVSLVVLVLGQAILLISAAVVFGFKIVGRISDIRFEASQERVKYEHRFTDLEGKCERWFILAGMAAGHSPDNHHKADADLEGFVTEYKKHHHDLPDDRWTHYQSVFSKLMANLNATPNERLLFEGYKELCEHKMMRGGNLWKLEQVKL